MADDRGRRLDQPSATRLGRSGLRLAVNSEWFARIAERLARFLGTGTFLFWQSLFVVVWVALNLVMVAHRWDPYPFILLNLAFSTQAAYAAPLILLAQNRQDDRDRIALEEDRSRASRTSAETEYLARELAALRLAIGEVVTRDFLRGELGDRLGDRPERESPKAVTKAVDKAVDRAVERAVERALRRVLDEGRAADADTARTNGRDRGDDPS